MKLIVGESQFATWFEITAETTKEAATLARFGLNHKAQPHYVSVMPTSDSIMASISFTKPKNEVYHIKRA